MKGNASRQPLFNYFSLLKDLYLSGIWIGVAPRTDTKNTCSKEIGLHARDMIIVLGSIVNIIEGGT